MILATIPFDSDALPFTIFIGVVCLVIGIVTFSVLRVYLKKKKRPTLYLFLGILCWFLGILGFFIGLLSWGIVDNRIWIYDASLPWGYSSIIVSGFFFLLFALDIFSPSKSAKKNFAIIAYAIYMVLLVASFFNFKGNQWGILPPIPNYRLINLVLMILGQLLLYIMLIVNTRRLIKHVEGEDKSRLKYIFYFSVLLLSCFILMVASEVSLMFVSNPPPFGPLEFVAWAVGLVAMFYARQSFAKH